MYDFVPLHNHSHYSVLDSVNTVEKIVETVHSYGYPGFALNEHGTLGSYLDAYQCAKKYGIKYIPGIEFYVAPRSRFDKDPAEDKGYYHLCMYAMDYPALQALFTLVTESNRYECFYHKPRIDKDLIAEYGRKYNLICSSACLAGEIHRSILKNLEFQYEGEDKAQHTEAKTKKLLKYYKDIFGDRYYIEFHNHDIEAEHVAAEALYDLANKMHIKTIFVTDAHYLHPEDQKLHNIMMAIKMKKPLEEAGFDGVNHCFLPYETIGDLAYTSEAVENTMEIFERCNVEIPLGQVYMPKAPGIQKSDKHTLRQLCVKKLHDLFEDNIPNEYIERLDYEFNVIANMGFAGYFLIVKDIMDYARSQDIITGYGRGSVGGSLIAYLLGITRVNPMLHPDMIFERFLNESRAAIPQLHFNPLTNGGQHGRQRNKKGSRKESSAQKRR